MKQEQHTPYKKRSQMQEIARRFVRNKQAVVGLIMLMILILAAILAPVIAPYDPLKQDLLHRLCLICVYFTSKIMERYFFVFHLDFFLSER